MSNAPAKTFDAVRMVRAVRDEVSSMIATMSVEEENRWLRSEPFADATLRHLMELAARPDGATEGRSRPS